MARAGQGGEDEKGWRGVEEGGRRKGAGREGGRGREREREREKFLLFPHVLPLLSALTVLCNIGTFKALFTRPKSI